MPEPKRRRPTRFRGQLNRYGRKQAKMSTRRLVRGMMAALTPQPFKWLSAKATIGNREATIGNREATIGNREATILAASEAQAHRQADAWYAAYLDRKEARP